MSIPDFGLPSCPGSYLLWLYLPHRTYIAVGKLGEQLFGRGWYGYCGSARGPGGLRARLGHHLLPAERPHWHIDYLRLHAQPRYIWLTPEINIEHRWASQLAACREARQPVAGFGASDCRCSSHLVFLPRKMLFRGLCLQPDIAKRITIR